MSPKALRKVIEYLNDKRKEAVRDIRWGFLHVEANMVPGKLELWLVRNFDTYSCSLPLTDGSMRLTEHDVHVTLGLPKDLLEAVKPKNERNVNVELASLLNHWKQQWPECDSIPKCEEVIDMMRGQVDGGEHFRRNFIMLVVSTCLRGRQRGEVNYLIMNTLVDLRKLR